MSKSPSINSALTEPTTKKGIFIIPPKRNYKLEFDANTTIKELKIMIGKAANLKNIPIRLFSEGKEYTNYNELKFETLFPNENNIIFTVEINKHSEIFSQDEITVYIKTTCQKHPDKFLHYYCFTCNDSVCYECLTEGAHINHLIKDKWQYLLPSGFLAEKTFEKYTQKDLYDYMASQDLTEFKKQVNEIMFENIFNMIRTIKDNFNTLIDKYINFNQTSIYDISDSIKDMKASLVKYLDKLKESLNVNDVINNIQIFTTFDSNYKEINKLLNDKIESKIFKIRQLKEEISSSITIKINKIYSSIKELLNHCIIDDDNIFNIGNSFSTDIKNIKIGRTQNAFPRGFRNTINNINSNFNSNFGGIFNANAGIRGNRLSSQVPRKDIFNINSLEIDDVSNLLGEYYNKEKMQVNQNMCSSLYQMVNENNNSN